MQQLWGLGITDDSTVGGGLPVAIWVLDGKVISFPSFSLSSLAPPYLGGVWGASMGSVAGLLFGGLSMCFFLVHFTPTRSALLTRQRRASRV